MIFFFDLERTEMYLYHSYVYLFPSIFYGIYSSSCTPYEFFSFRQKSIDIESIYYTDHVAALYTVLVAGQGDGILFLPED